MTKNHRLIYKPLEKLQIQKKGSVAIEEVKIGDRLDIRYKHGVYNQVKSFLGDKKNLCTIEEQVTNAKIYNRILTNK